MSVETITTPPPDAGAVGDGKSQAEAKPDQPGVQKTPEQREQERKWKLKFGKSEREVTEAELIAEAQKGWASDEKFKAAARKERELKEALENGNLEYVLKKMKGKGEIEWAKEVLKKELARRSMTPQQAEEEEHKAEIARLKAEREKLEKDEAERIAKKRQEHYEQQYDRELSEALKAHKLPANKYLVGRAITIASEIVNMGLDPDFMLVVKEAKRQVQEEMQQLIDDDPSFVGPDRAQKISKWLVSQGMPKKEADAQAIKAVRQSDKNESLSKMVDENEYWEKKRKQWSK